MKKISQVAMAALPCFQLLTTAVLGGQQELPLAKRVGDDEDIGRSFLELCNRAGFDFEEHTVVTEDGYILSLYRIPGLLTTEDGEDEQDVVADLETTEKPAVLFQHGFLDSAYSWVIHYSDVAPAFVAARAGYDVWMNNSRGNTYSRKHLKWDPDVDKTEYWNFDWQEMGRYDLPAVIDYILSGKNDQQKIAYIGHSQGSTQMYYALAENVPNLKEKLSLFVALGSATKLPNNFAFGFEAQLTFYREIDYFMRLMGVHEVFTKNWQTPRAAWVCRMMPTACKFFYMHMINDEPKVNDDDRFNVYGYGHFPHGAPANSWRHFCQNAIEDRFQEFIPDYSGAKRKSKKIPLSEIKDIPIAIFAGKNDELADTIDAQWTKDQIGDAVVHYQQIPGGHITFLVGKDMSYFTRDVVSLLTKYHPTVEAQAEHFLQSTF